MGLEMQTTGAGAGSAKATPTRAFHRHQFTRLAVFASAPVLHCTAHCKMPQNSVFGFLWLSKPSRCPGCKRKGIMIVVFDSSDTCKSRIITIRHLEHRSSAS